MKFLKKLFSCLNNEYEMPSAFQQAENLHKHVLADKEKALHAALDGYAISQRVSAEIKATPYYQKVVEFCKLNDFDGRFECGEHLVLDNILEDSFSLREWLDVEWLQPADRKEFTTAVDDAFSNNNILVDWCKGVNEPVVRLLQNWKELFSSYEWERLHDRTKFTFHLVNKQGKKSVITATRVDDQINFPSIRSHTIEFDGNKPPFTHCELTLISLLLDREVADQNRKREILDRGVLAEFING